MEMILQAFEDIHLTKNHLKQLHRDLLRYSQKGECHRGAYKKLSNNVVTFDTDIKVVGVFLRRPRHLIPHDAGMSLWGY